MKTRTGQRGARALVDHFPARLHAQENLPPEGPALLVGNHALFGFDTLVLTALMLLETPRKPRFLAERIFWKIPGWGPALLAAGAVPGEPGAAVELLRQGEIVIVYPGGIDDSFKPPAEAYRLKWGTRAGFARVAMRAGAPIIPVAAVGVDELFEVRWREPLVGRRLFGSSRYDLPVPARILPRKIPLDYHLQPPLPAPGDPEDPAAVERVRSATQASLEQILAPHRRDAGRGDRC
jgi:1-acyl-sn-glycerol-3-phosphate acyltransferase